MLALLAIALLSGGTSLDRMTPAELDTYAASLQEREPEFENRLRDVAFRSVGTPYCATGPLGEGPDGEYDKDPLVDFTQVDCVTFVEQSIALAASKSYDEAVALLQRIRYKDGRIDYEARNHFMETDWFPNNPFCRDVTAELGVPTAVVTRTISRREFFQRVKAPALGQQTPDQTVHLTHIPSAGAEAAEHVIPSPAVVCFIGKTDWLFAVHCGLFIRDDDGKPHLVHASLPDKQVVDVDFSDYVKSQSRFIGFTVHQIANPVGK